MAKPRKQTYTLEMYLGKMRDQDIRTDADVQRLSGAWNNSMASELIISVLNGEYVPPIILGMEENSQSWIIDGLQRSTTLMLFRFGNLKISPNIEEPVITYRAKARDAEGNIKFDGCGDIIWETKTFDLRRKTYEKLPEELKKTFNEYQLETVIHENYSMEQISRLVRRFNFSKGMTVSQKTLTFCDRYARKIRNILRRKFFIEALYTKAERKNGTVERILMESVMVMFHLDDWKKSSAVGAYLNENAAMEEFDILEDCIRRLEGVVTDETYKIFTNKDSFLWFTLFHKFTKLNIDDGKFAGFLNAFQNGLCDKEVNGKLFYEKGRSLKDRNVIVEKLDLLETLMLGFLDIPKPEAWSEEILAFVRENVAPNDTMEDILLYKDMLMDFAGKADKDSRLLDVRNQPSMIAVIAYGCHEEITLDRWIEDYFNRNGSYISDQAENFKSMCEDLAQFVKAKEAA